MADDIITNIEAPQSYTTAIKELVETLSIELHDCPYTKRIRAKLGRLLEQEIDFQLEYQADGNNEYRRSKARGPAEVRSNVKPLK